VAKCYSNENFPLQVVFILRSFGHDVLTSYESGKANQAIPDEEVLKFSTETERILLTFNRKHFIKLHAEFPDHAGIIVCTIDSDFHGFARRIHDVLESTDGFQGKLLRINRPSL
jgi:hypothetical protein